MVKSMSKESFGSLFERSWKEYKANFKPIFWLMFWFMLIPGVVSLVILIAGMLSNEEVRQLILNPGTSSLPAGYMAANIIIGIVSFLLLIFASASLTRASLKKSKFSFRDLTGLGSRDYFRYLGLTVVFYIFVLLWGILLIIPGIIFFTYWYLSFYVIFDKNEKILKSLKKSRMMIKGRWWRTFGYILLLGLLSLAVIIIATIIEVPFNLQYIGYFTEGDPLSATNAIISAIVSTIVKFASSLIIYPVWILFWKNYYLSLK